MTIRMAHGAVNGRAPLLYNTLSVPFRYSRKNGKKAKACLKWAHHAYYFWLAGMAGVVLAGVDKGARAM